LKRWVTHGCPVDCGEDWSWQVIQQAVLQGPHRSATTKDSIDLLREDIEYQVKAGFSEIISWEKLQRIRPRRLKISPVAVVPQRNRQGRIILDLSFPVYLAGPTRQDPLQESMNDSTVPSALQMGWTESPGFFAAATETIRDNTQHDLDCQADLKPHPMEPFTTPTESIEPGDGRYGNYVYVDDFINIASEDESRTRLIAVARASLHPIHEIFPPPEVTGHVGGKDPVSLKKLKKGDAPWAAVKEVLGFMFDGEQKTVYLPQDKSDDIIQELNRVLKKGKVPFKHFRSLLGKLCHVAIILPGLRGLFTPTNKILRAEPSSVSLSSQAPMRQAFKDIKYLVRQLAQRPTHASKLVQGDDDFLGYCDASAAGAGGVWFGPGLDTPIVWRYQFHPDITNQVVSDDNPTGTITNLDLELVVVLLQVAVLCSQVDPTHKKLGILSDNSATVYWAKRMAS
jgi:hypothetical protein